jgi:hypothetical protein
MNIKNRKLTQFMIIDIIFKIFKRQRRFIYETAHATRGHSGDIQIYAEIRETAQPYAIKKNEYSSKFISFSILAK